MGTEQSSWICEVRAALGKSDADADLPRLMVWKVPALYRTNAEHYEPVSWRFGLHNCPEIPHANGTERFKIRVARALALTGEQWDSFCQRVVPEPKEYWEAVYGQSPHASSYTIEEIRCLLSLDALFLVVYLRLLGGRIKRLRRALQKVITDPVFQIYIKTLCLDLRSVENQIPMELLKRVVGILSTEFKDNVGDMPAWKDVNVQPAWEDVNVQLWQGLCIGKCILWCDFHDPSIDDIKREVLFQRRMGNWLKHADSYDDLHILDSTYRILCGWENLETPHGNPCLHRYSATDLQACGVKIKGKEFTCFEDISFENGCLSVPFLQVFDESEKFLRNLIVHEELSRPRGMRQNSVNCYTFFMEGLMRTPEDVKLLVKQGVLSVNVGSHDIVVNMWKHINYNIPVPRVSDKFFTMLTNLRNYTKLRRNKYRFEFKKQFCSRPWIPLSYLAATIITVATLMQTYAAVIASNGMKPHFPPH